MNIYQRVALPVVAAALCGCLVNCSDDSGGSPLSPPSPSELLGAWRVVRETVALNMFSSESDTSDDVEVVLHFGSGLLTSYSPEVQGDSLCYCAGTITYTVSGDEIAIDYPIFDSIPGQYDMTMTYANRGNQLVLTMAGSITYQDSSFPGTVSGTVSMDMTFDPYTGQTPPPMCEVCAQPMPLGKETAQVEANSLQGWWVFSSMSYTTEITGSGSESYSDTSRLIEFTADSAHYYFYDPGATQLCHAKGSSDYTLSGSSLLGEAFSGADTTLPGEIVTMTTSAVMQGSQLVLTRTVVERGDGAGAEITTTEKTTRLARFDGSVPPQGWPQLVCPGQTVFWKRQADMVDPTPEFTSPFLR
jgi:hypothetical protein